MLNFFSYIEPGYRFGEGKDSFDDVLEATKQYFEENLSKEKIAERMNNLIAYEKHKIFKWAPLELKNCCIKMGAKLAEREVTMYLQKSIRKALYAWCLCKLRNVQYILHIPEASSPHSY